MFVAFIDCSFVKVCVRLPAGSFPINVRKEYLSVRPYQGMFEKYNENIFKHPMALALFISSSRRVKSPGLAW
jgi:hypothetical protein